MTQTKQDAAEMMQAHKELLALADRYALTVDTVILPVIPNFIFRVEPSRGRNDLRYMTVTLRYLKYELTAYGPEMAVIQFATPALKLLREFV